MAVFIFIFNLFKMESKFIPRAFRVALAEIYVSFMKRSKSLIKIAIAIAYDCIMPCL